MGPRAGLKERGEKEKCYALLPLPNPFFSKAAATELGGGFKDGHISYKMGLSVVSIYFQGGSRQILQCYSMGLGRSFIVEGEELLSRVIKEEIS